MRFTLQLRRKTDITPGVSRAGLRQLPTSKSLRENQCLTVASSFQTCFLLWAVSQPSSYLQLKFALTPTPAFLFGNSWTHPHFILCFPCPCLACPQTFTVISLLSLCSACHSLFCMKLGRLPDTAGILTKNLQGYKALPGPFLRRYV